MSAEDPKIAQSLADLITTLVKGLCMTGTQPALAQARAIIEAARVACDRATGMVNDTARREVSR